MRKKKNTSKKPATPRITRATLLAKVPGISDSTVVMLNEASLIKVGDLLTWIEEGNVLMDIEGMTSHRVTTIRKNLGDKIDAAKAKASKAVAAEDKVEEDTASEPAEEVRKLLASAGIVSAGQKLDAQKLKGRVAIIRCGKAVDEDTTLIEEGAEEVIMLNIDAESELRARGLAHDGMTNFAIEYYFPMYGAGTYGELEKALMADPRFKERVATVKDTIFQHVPLEAQIWENHENPADSLSAQTVDDLGGGGVVYPGSLRLFTAVRGRPYAPGGEGGDDWMSMAYDPRDDREEHPNLPVRSSDVQHVSLLSDLIAALKREKVDIAVIVGGFDGATGSSSLVVLSQLLTPLKDFSTVPLVMVTLPEYFLVDGHVKGPHADRLNAIISILGRCGVLAGIGQDGIIWKAIVDHVRTWGGLFSNVYAVGKQFQAAPVLTITVLPKRSDMDTRYLLGLAAGSKLSVAEARKRLIQHSQPDHKRRIKFKQVRYRTDLGVKVTLSNAGKVIIHDWNSVMPALAVANRSIGEMTIPLEVSRSTGGGLFGKAKSKRVENLPVAEVPLVPSLMDGVGADKVRTLEAQPEVWALLKPEQRLLKHHEMVPFVQAFEAIDRDFLTLVTDDLNNTVFKHRAYNPDFVTYGTVEGEESDDANPLPKTVVAWGVLNVGTDAYADELLGHIFADVDRSAEEAEALRKKEAEREKRIQQQTEQALKNILGDGPLGVSLEKIFSEAEGDDKDEEGGS